MKAIIGKKIEMTQIFSPQGEVLPVTKVKAFPVTVTQVKTADKDGYNAVQVGCDSKRHLKKPQLGHLKGNKFRVLKEFQLDNQELSVGDSWGAEQFSAGDKVKITAKSKGKGFQGVVKRWKFHGAPATHGTKDQVRMPGSAGATGPARVFPGKPMPGRMGDENITVSNLEVVQVDEAEGFVYLKGSVPGARNNWVYIQAEGEIEISQSEATSEDEAVPQEKEDTQQVDNKSPDKPAEDDSSKEEDKQKEEAKAEDKPQTDK